MLNDRLNNNSKFDLKAKFRDKKFVSAVGIGIFVLILIIVLIASCNKKKDPKDQKKNQKGQQTVVTPPPAPQPVQPPVQPPVDADDNNDENSGRSTARAESGDAQSLMQEGMEYYNGDNGKKRNYREARKCFVKAKALGAKNADTWIKQCDKKLPKAKKGTKKRR